MSPAVSTRGLLLDTHVWVRFVSGSGELKRSVIDSIEEARCRNEVFVSVISAWEVAMLVHKKRLLLPGSVQGWVEQALKLPGLRLLPLSPEIVVRAVELPETLNADPSDRMLVASAQLETLAFVTRDKNILRFAAQQKIACVQA